MSGRGDFKRKWGATPGRFLRSAHNAERQHPPEIEGQQGAGRSCKVSRRLVQAATRNSMVARRIGEKYLPSEESGQIRQRRELGAARLFRKEAGSDPAFDKSGTRCLIANVPHDGALRSAVSLPRCLSDLPYYTRYLQCDRRHITSWLGSTI